MYYNGDKILNNPQPFNFLLGNRGIGKSFYWKCYVVKDYLKNKKQFIYTRRYKSDIDKVVNNLFDDILPKFPDVDIYNDKNKIMINGEIAGYCIAVSEFIKYKSASFQDVDTILFDEFLPEDGKYLGGKSNPNLEPELCLNFYQTVARGYNRPIRDDVLFIFISNSVTINNPYFYFYNIDKKLSFNTKFLRGDGFNVEINRNESISKEISESKFGKLINGTRYGEYALGNEFYLDTNEFIKKIPGNKDYILTFKYNSNYYGLWRTTKGFYYITTKTDRNCKNVFTLTSESHDETTVLISKLNDYILKELINNYSLGYVYFENQRCKKFFETAFLK